MLPIPNVVAVLVRNIQSRDVPRRIHNRSLDFKGRKSDSGLLSIVSRRSVDAVKASTTDLKFDRNYDKVDWEAYCTSTRTTSMSVDCFYPQTTVGEGLSSCVPGLIGPGNAVQFAIHIMYASSDLPAFPTGYSSGGIGQGGFVTAPAFAEHIPGSTIVVSTDEAGSRSGTSGADKPSESPGSPGEIRTGLSTGAIAGVSVGAVLVIAALLVAVWLFLRRRKRRSSKKQAIGNVPTGRDDDKEVTFEHKSFSKDSKDVFTELDGRTKQMNELSGSGQVLLHNELSSVQDHRPHELPHKAIKATAIDHVVRLPQADGTSARNTPGDSSLSATNLGPVGDHLYNPYPGNHDADVVSRAQPAQSVVEQTNALQAREDVELRYLEDEEQRIRERKEAILANRAGS